MKQDKPRTPRFQRRRRSEKPGAAEGPSTESSSESEASATLPSQAGDLAHFAALARQFDVGMLTTRRANGTLIARPLYLAGFDDDGTIWLVSSTDSKLVQEVTATREVAFSMQSRMRFLSVSATCERIQDPKLLAQHWRPSFRVWFPSGPADENAILLKLTPVEMEYWDQSGAYGARLVMQAARALLTRTSLTEAALVGHGRVHMAPSQPEAAQAQA